MIMLIMMIIEFNTYQYCLNYKLKHPKLNYGPDLTLHITSENTFKGKH